MESYPSDDRNLPDRKEIYTVIQFAEELFDKVCEKLKISKSTIL